MKSGMEQIKFFTATGRVMRSLSYTMLGFLCFCDGACGKGEKDSVQLLPSSQPGKHRNGLELTLMIDGTPVLFPGVEMRAQATGNGVAMQIDTPALDSVGGNALNFDLTLEEIEDPADLTTASWHFSTDDPERLDTLNGITLNGRNVVLEPMEIHLSFVAGEDGKIIIVIDGQFRWFEPADAETALKVVAVRGRVEARRM